MRMCGGGGECLLCVVFIVTRVFVFVSFHYVEGCLGQVRVEKQWLKNIVPVCNKKTNIPWLLSSHKHRYT